MNKPDWIVHYVTEHCKCSYCNKEPLEENNVGFTGFGNTHTHGLDRYGHDEIGLSLDITGEYGVVILNSVGYKIRDGATYKEGRYSEVIQDFDVLFYKPVDSNILFMLLPDTNGFLPGEIECDFPYNQQKFYADIIAAERKEHEL